MQNQDLVSTLLGALQQTERNLTQQIINMDTRIADEICSLGKEIDDVRKDVSELDKSYALLEARFMEILRIDKRLEALENANKSTTEIKVSASNMFKWISGGLGLLIAVGTVLKVFGIL